MDTQVRKTLLTIIEERDLRRAGLVSYLRAWAETHELTMIALPASCMLDENESAICRMVIYSLGPARPAPGNISAHVQQLRRIAPNAALIVLSDRDEPQEVFEALGAGASGFVPTSLEPGLALQAFSFILNGGLYFPAFAIRPLLATASPPSSKLACDDKAPHGQCGVPLTGQQMDASQPAGSGLTAREQEVLQLLQLGQTNKVIARQLGTTEATAKVHVRQIMRKLGAANRTQAALNGKSLQPFGVAEVVLENEEP